MALNNLRKLLSGSEAQAAHDAMLRALDLILESLAVHAVNTEPAGLAHFQALFRRYAAELPAKSADPRETLALSAAIIQSIREHNEAAGRQFHAQRYELQRIIAMLIAALKSLCPNQRLLATLRGLEAQLQSAASLEDLRPVRGRFEECMAALRIEGRPRLDVNLAPLEAPPHPGATPLSFEADAAGNDALTGLPCRDQAVMAIQHADDAPPRKFGAVLVLDCLGAILDRFGRDTADSALLHATRTLRQKLAGGDVLYRWQGASLFLVLPRQAPSAIVQREVARLASPRIECTVNVSGRSVLLPLPITWTCLPLWEAPPAEIVTRIDSYVNKRPSDAPVEAP